MKDNSVEHSSSVAKRLFIAVAGSSAIWAAMGAADTAKAADTGGASLTDALRVCAEIADTGERLACFELLAADTAATADSTPSPATQITADAPDTAPAIAAAPTAPPNLGDDYVVLKKEEAEELRRRAGVGDDFVVLPKKEAAELRRQADANKRTEKREPYASKIIGVFTTGYKITNVALENGEVWRELSMARGKRPRKGDAVRLAPASMGSWTVQYGGRSAKFKVKRVR